MKRLLSIMYVVAITTLLVSCSKGDDPTAQDFCVNVYYTYSDYSDYGERLASPSYVLLFKDNGNNIDESKMSITDLQLYDTNGNALDLIRTSPSTSGVNTFEGVENGKYVILALYSPYTFVKYYSYKKISVDYDYRVTTEKIVFDCTKDSGYQTWK